MLWKRTPEGMHRWPTLYWTNHWNRQWGNDEPIDSSDFDFAPNDHINKLTLSLITVWKAFNHCFENRIQISVHFIETNGSKMWRKLPLFGPNLKDTFPLNINLHFIQIYRNINVEKVIYKIKNILIRITNFFLLLTRSS